MIERRDDSPELAPTRSAIAGRRRRRLRRAALLLLALAATATVLGVIAVRRARPEVRRPGEALPDITDRLARNLPPEAPPPRFTDVTSSAGLGEFTTFAGPRSSQLPEDMGPGAAWGDFDNDGDDDLFLVAAGGALTSPPETRAACALYENLADGTFRVVEEFPPTRIMGMAAAWADYDGDGWLDLVVTGYECLRLYRNEGGRLLLDPALTDLEGFWASAVWGDFDNDRDLDLYVCGYVKYDAESAPPRPATRQYGSSVPYTLNPAAFEPERNLLFRNDGDRTFTEVAAELGVANPEGRSLGALWHDFDDDGWLDLYVANDISDNALFLNRGGSFEDASLAAHVADYRGAMGLAAGDWNRDGDDDLFVTHWIAQENALYDSLLQDLRAVSTDGSPALRFTDVASLAGVGHIALHSVGWGTEFADFDGDGWLDLVVANGSTVETNDAPKRLKPEPAMLLWNRRGETFHDLAPALDVLSAPKVARGLAVSDYDGDGDLDVLIMHLGAGAQLLRNDMQTGNWLQLRLRSRLGPSGEARGRGEGSTVTVHAGEMALRRSVTSASYLSQSSRSLHFGLGAAEAIDRVEVRWHGGRMESYEGLEANAVWELTEGQPRPRSVKRDAAVPRAALDRPQLVAFWAAQRGAMDAMKRDRDIPRATALFREALAIDPQHEDARYYLANCLAAQGETDEALRHLEILLEINPLSHRASKQWGVLRAMTAESSADLAEAEAALERSLEINREETGALHVAGEIALLQGRDSLADQRFEWVCRTNPRAVGGLFLRGYIAWKTGRDEDAAGYLDAARQARGEDWKPVGAVAEGDVASRMHDEVSPLSVYWESWNGTRDPDRAFPPLRAFLDDHDRWR